MCYCIFNKFLSMMIRQCIVHRLLRIDWVHCALKFNGVHYALIGAFNNTKQSKCLQTAGHKWWFRLLRLVLLKYPSNSVYSFIGFFSVRAFPQINLKHPVLSPHILYGLMGGGIGDTCHLWALRFKKPVNLKTFKVLKSPWSALRPFYIPLTHTQIFGSSIGKLTSSAIGPNTDTLSSLDSSLM